MAAAARVDWGMSFLSRLLARLLGDGDKPERLPSPDEIVVLARPDGEPEAMLLLQMLADQGIHAMVRNRDAASARGGGWGSWWAYEVCVLRRDLRRAREIIGAQ
jgi:hypothetical protein